MKKKKQKELDVDFIGGQGPLTKNEEQAISEFIKAQKLLRVKKTSSNDKKQRGELKLLVRIYSCP